MTLIPRVLRAAGAAAAGILTVGILLYVLEANSDNALVGAVLDVAVWLAGPFRGIFDLAENKAQVIVNWGLGAGIYALAAMLLAGLVERALTRLADREGHSGQAREA